MSMMNIQVGSRWRGKYSAKIAIVTALDAHGVWIIWEEDTKQEQISIKYNEFDRLDGWFVPMDTPIVGPKGGTGTPPKWTADLLALLKTKIEKTQERLDANQYGLYDYFKGRLKALKEIQSYLEDN